MNLRALAVTPLLIGSLVTVPAFADAPAVPASAVTEDVTLQAREHFAQATKLYKDGDFDAALVQFERAYELKPNYKVLYNIGQTYFQLREYVEARDSMARYVKEGGDQIDVERLAAVNKDLADLERRLAKISVEAPNRGVLQRQIRVAGGDQQVLTLTFEDAPRTVIVKTVPQDVKPRLGAGFWATAIGAVALGAGAGVTGYFAFQAQDDNRRQKKEFGVTPSQLSDSNNRAKSLALTTDILSGAALVCAGVATVILVTSPSHPRSASLGLNVGLGSAELSGWF
jgi:tetratricopeptide (TPR) repeat protein